MQVPNSDASRSDETTILPISDASDAACDIVLPISYTEIMPCIMPSSIPSVPSVPVSLMDF